MISPISSIALAFKGAVIRKDAQTENAIKNLPATSQMLAENELDLLRSTLDERTGKNLDVEIGLKYDTQFSDPGKFYVQIFTKDAIGRLPKNTTIAGSYCEIDEDNAKRTRVEVAKSFIHARQDAETAIDIINDVRNDI